MHRAPGKRAGRRFPLIFAAREKKYQINLHTVNFSFARLMMCVAGPSARVAQTGGST